MNKPFRLCYQTFGNPNHPCIILITGIGGQLIDWPLALTQGLADKGFYVVTFDNRDSGLSRRYEELGVPNLNEAIAIRQQGKNFTPPYTLEDLAQDVIALMNELVVKKAHIIGGSMGGIIAQYVALNFPNRVLSLTCLSSTSGDPTLPPSNKEVSAFFAAALNRESQSLESFINNKLELYKIYLHPNNFDEEKIRKQLTASYHRANDPTGFKRLILAMISAEPRTNDLKKLKLPCLIVHGDSDPVFPLKHGEHLAKSIADSHLEIIENMGHELPDFACKKIVDLFVKYFK